VSSKRVLKKQQKRQASALEELEALYRRGADEELLARAAEQIPDVLSSPFGAKWAEAADRALRQSLSRADFGRLAALLRSLRRSGPPRPLALLAEAVLDVAAGRLEAARSRLAALSSAQDAGAVSRELLTALQALARDEPPTDDPYLRTAGDLFAALQGLQAHAFAPTADDLRILTRSLQAVRDTAPPAAADLRLLLDSAGRCLALLTDLSTLATRLARLPAGEEPQASEASPAVIAWLRGPGISLAAALASTPAASAAPLIAPLQHALRLRWRTLLDQVAAREGPPGLAALYAADPKLLAADVDLPGGTQDVLAEVRQRGQAQQLLAGRRNSDLADLLRSRSRTAAASGDLAALWSLELWALGRPAAAEDEEGEEDDDGEDPLSDFAEPTAHRALRRLHDMAGEIGRRFPAEHRAEVAQVLRGALFDFCEGINFCEHTAGAALGLLEHLPGGAGGVGDVCDVGLLIAGVAGAVTGRDHRILRSFQTRLAGGAKVQAGDQETVQRLMAQVAQEEPGDIARILETLKPFFTADAWTEIPALVAREMGGRFVHSLIEASLLAEGRDPGRRELDPVRRRLDALRPALGGTHGFAAMDLALDCWQPDRFAAERWLERFLAACPDLERPLTALRLLAGALTPWTPDGIDTALGGLAEAVIDRLDGRWRLWGSDVPMLALAAGSGHCRSLEKKVRRLLASKEIRQGEGREILERALKAIQRVGRDLPKPGWKGPRRRRAGAPQLRLDSP
jgi:hypothetical protein